MLKQTIEWEWKSIKDDPPVKGGFHYWVRELEDGCHFGFEQMALLYIPMNPSYGGKPMVLLIDQDGRIPLSDFDEWAGPIPYMPIGE